MFHGFIWKPNPARWAYYLGVWIAQQNTAQITTSFTLSIEQQRQISKVFHDVFDASIHVNFNDDPDLLCGIEWRSNGQKISWNLKEYLNSMELNIQ